MQNLNALIDLIHKTDSEKINVYKPLINDFLISWDFQECEWKATLKMLDNLKDRLEYINIVCK